MQTLAALLDHDGSAKHAAEALFCHRNTVIYRARQIEELTGRRLGDPRDKLLLGLGSAGAQPGPRGALSSRQDRLAHRARDEGSVASVDLPSSRTKRT